MQSYNYNQPDANLNKKIKHLPIQCYEEINRIIQSNSLTFVHLRIQKITDNNIHTINSLKKRHIFL